MKRVCTTSSSSSEQEKMAKSPKQKCSQVNCEDYVIDESEVSACFKNLYKKFPDEKPPAVDILTFRGVHPSYKTDEKAKSADDYPQKCDYDNCAFIFEYPFAEHRVKSAFEI